MNYEEFVKIITNPSISALLGVILGSVSTFVVGSLIEYFKTRKFKRNIRTLVKTEFAEYRNYFEDVIKKGIVHKTNPEWICIEPTSELGIRWNRLKSAQFDSYFDPKNYPKLKIETKAIAFDNHLMDIEDTYYEIKNFRYDTPATEDGQKWIFAFDKSKMEDLIKKIRNLEHKI